MKKWEQLKYDIDAAVKAMETEEPEELYNIRHCCVGNEAGSYDQQWAPIDFSNGMIRDFSMYTMYPIYKLAFNDAYDLRHLREAFLVFHPPYCNYLGYTGLRQMQEFSNRFEDCFDEFETKDDFISVYQSFLIYTNKLAAWSYHYFTWDMGYSWNPEPVK